MTTPRQEIGGAGCDYPRLVGLMTVSVGLLFTALSIAAGRMPYESVLVRFGLAALTGGLGLLAWVFTVAWLMASLHPDAARRARFVTWFLRPPARLDDQRNGPADAVAGKFRPQGDERQEMVRPAGPRDGGITEAERKLTDAKPEPGRD